ncbi:sigma-70 family RNA polymerase sigma factor [Micromonospora terminaliae]|uniref:Sigma-70 family RNA polymerase sigma factor n=1 Tax=Micromonospora terminaliae TaxID=1914461 RepID=A0AAJ3DIB4_9ACTN|nr:RNA polymerase sigma factor ShbA [Micromonospora terminaliae]NES27589.1 sigma-70 family RNA polymerase sigma factor [Micromonospora terminaliae]QGL47684.1 sigma-70 family RNA polymerase sigma factor [Micromonospora terminaliae]
MTTVIESELVRRAAAGDPAAVEELLVGVRPGLVRYCRARLGRVGGAYTTADDVAQEVCVAVLRALPRYRDQGAPFAAFVYGIAAHKVADAQRSAVRDAAVTPTDAPVDRPDAAPGPEQQAVASDLARRLSALLDRLPDAQREIILLRVAAGLSAEEVGGIVGMSAAAVRMAQSRALARLRTLAGGSLDEVAA